MNKLSEKTLSKVSRKSLVDEVIAAIKRMLNEEAWPPGTKLPSEQQLCNQLGVGRSTLREALRVLGHLGLVESRSGLGTFVVDQKIPQARLEYPQTPEALVELFEFRHIVEVPAARLAAERRTQADITRVRAAWDKCEDAVNANSADEFARLDYWFHFSVVETSHNDFLIGAYRSLEAVFPNYVNQVLALGALHSMLHFHDGLIEAVEQGDPEKAAAAVEENFRETDVRLRMLLENEAQ